MNSQPLLKIYTYDTHLVWLLLWFLYQSWDFKDRMKRFCEAKKGYKTISRQQEKQTNITFFSIYVQLPTAPTRHSLGSATFSKNPTLFPKTYSLKTHFYKGNIRENLVNWSGLIFPTAVPNVSSLRSLNLLNTEEIKWIFFFGWIRCLSLLLWTKETKLKSCLGNGQQQEHQTS